MTYYLDTDICISAMKGQVPSFVEWMKSLSPDRIKIPAIVKAELLLGAKKSDRSKGALSTVEDFLEPFEIVPFCDQCAVVYSEIRAELERKGRSIGPNDLLIAVTVATHQGALVTQNTREFSRIPALRLHPLPILTP